MSERRPGGRDLDHENRPANVLSYERGRMRQALPKIVARCMAFSAMTCFDDALVAAVYRFYGLEVDVATAETEILEDEAERVRFFPWFLWDYRAEDGGPTLGERFLGEVELTPFEAELVAGLCRSHVGLFEVVERTETVVVLSDVATDEVVSVPDEALAADVAEHQIVQARLVRVGGRGPVSQRGGAEVVALVDAVYGLLPREARPAVRLELETLLGDGPDAIELLKAYTPELLDFADHLIDSFAQPPAAHNAEGDDLALTVARLVGDDAQRVRRGLEEGLPRFAPTAPGLWLWQPDGHARGFVDTRSPTVVLGANSPRRHDALTADLAEALAFAPSPFKVVEDFGRAVARWAERGGADPWLTVDPEVRGAVREWFSAWARQWVDTPSSTLGERTPREAVRDSSGRATVESMMRRFDDLILGELGPISRLSLDSLRVELGLPAQA